MEGHIWAACGRCWMIPPFLAFICMKWTRKETLIMLHSWPLDDDQGHGNVWQLAYAMELSHFVSNRHQTPVHKWDMNSERKRDSFLFLHVDFESSAANGEPISCAQSGNICQCVPGAYMERYTGMSLAYLKHTAMRSDLSDSRDVSTHNWEYPTKHLLVSCSVRFLCSAKINIKHL
jgi:hypothetical protein